MSITVWVLIALAIIGAIVWMLRKRSIADGVSVYTDRRRDSSRVVSLAEFIDGSRHMPVSLALTDLSFYYENSDMQASLERQWIHEVEYDDELTTGQPIGDDDVSRDRDVQRRAVGLGTVEHEQLPAITQHHAVDRVALVRTIKRNSRDTLCHLELNALRTFEPFGHDSLSFEEGGSPACRFSG